MAAVVVGARRSPPREVWKVGAAGSPGSGRDGLKRLLCYLAHFFLDIAPPYTSDRRTATMDGGADAGRDIDGPEDEEVDGHES